MNNDFVKEIQKGRPNVLRRGVLSLKVKKDKTLLNKESYELKPIYVVELMQENEQLSFVTVYEPHPNSNPVIKAYEKVKKKKSFSTETKLGQIANSTIKIPEKVIYQDKRPLFMAPVMDGVDTFTKVRGRGFYEREKDGIVVSGVGATFKEGKATGVFIGLDTIVWKDTVVLTSDILKQFEVNKQIWFNLEE